ncbi:L-threonylcarbamoyladenylate synthase [Chamaesiphon sp. VAR_48_metabat_135_sub]|uniref:L-threonylcarbamoyladenylate synthase n=1 Tax=Chamaesiphon sp. VAR_48_metabat_135_sub TaxID=2964699 RepID=UPI00286CCF67|nr:L-threonylcarbamoyladenylate synthase [Chamaesiphon sp. VAR_48_metabat_135_sub]
MPQFSLNRLIIAARTGNLISFPTDTVPALATLPIHAELIFQAKQRSQDKPLILMVGEVADIWQFTKGTEQELEIWQAVADRYLPGALTMVLPASDLLPAVMNPLGDRTIGLRVPDCNIARSILRQTGALATTSANLSGAPPLLTMAEISHNFSQVFTLDTDLNTPTAGQPSTVIEWTNSGWKLLRQGTIKFIETD